MTAEWTAGDGGTLRLFGTPAAGRDARQVVDDVIAEAFPDAAVAYEPPNATVGYELGYGWPPTSPRRADLIRCGSWSSPRSRTTWRWSPSPRPFRQFRPGFGPAAIAGQPQIAQDMGKYLDSFSWQGDPPR